MRQILSAGVIFVGATVASAAPFAYIPNSGDGTVSVIDTATETVVTTIPIPGPSPQSAVVSADGMRVYVGDLGGIGGRVHVIDATTNTVMASPAVLSGIVHAAISPDGAHVYASGGSSVKVVSTATNSLVLPIISDPSNNAPLAVAFHPTLPLAYAVGPLFQSTLVIDTTTRTVVTTIGTSGVSVAVHPDGTRGFVLATCTFCSDPPGVGQFDTATNLPVAGGSIATTGDQPRVLDLDPSGSPLYVTTHDTVLGPLLSVIDTTTDLEVAAVPLGTELWGVKLHPDGTRLYVADRGAGVVHVVDSGTLTVNTSIAVGTLPFARGNFIGPIADCGDGEVTFPEECDDGNLTSGDCCSSLCELEVALPCDDGDACTTDDQCDASASCVGGPPPDCDDGDLCTQDSCNPGTGCVNDDAPRVDCRAAGKALLLVKDSDDDGKDKLVWKWLKGDPIDAAELGNPVATTDYALCLHAGAPVEPIATYDVAAGSDWKATGSGFAYKATSGGADGIQKALLKHGAAGKTKTLVKGKGADLIDFDLTTLVEPVVVQLVSSEPSTICWEALYQESNFIKAEEDLFKAKVSD